MPRSFEEAQRALEVQRNSGSPDGVLVFDELGLFRLLDASEHCGEIER